MKIYTPYNGYSIIEDDGKYGFLRETDDYLVIPIIYDSVGVFDENETVKVFKDKKWFKINIFNEIIEELEETKYKVKKETTEDKWTIGSLVNFNYKGYQEKGVIVMIREKTVTVRMENGNEIWRYPKDITQVLLYEQL